MGLEMLTIAKHIVPSCNTNSAYKRCSMLYFNMYCVMLSFYLLCFSTFLLFVFIYIVLCPLHKQCNDTVSILHDGVIIGAGVAEPSTASSLTPDFYGNLCFPCFNVSIFVIL